MSTTDILDPADRLARQSATLQELTEAGMRLVRALTNEVEAPPARPVFGGDPALAFSRLSRSVRLTLALETKLAEPAPAPAPDAKKDFHGFRHVRGLILKDEACARVAEMIAAEAEAKAAEGGEGFDAERLMAQLDERLDERDDLEAIDDRPLVETVRLICRDLGVTFDEELWEDLSRQDVATFPLHHEPLRRGFRDFSEGEGELNPPSPWMGEGPPTVAPREGALDPRDEFACFKPRIDAPP